MSEWDRVLAGEPLALPVLIAIGSLVVAAMSLVVVVLRESLARRVGLTPPRRRWVRFRVRQAQDDLVTFRQWRAEAAHEVATLRRDEARLLTALQRAEDERRRRLAAVDAATADARAAYADLDELTVQRRRLERSVRDLAARIAAADDDARAADAEAAVTRALRGQAERRRGPWQRHVDKLAAREQELLAEIGRLDADLIAKAEEATTLDLTADEVRQRLDEAEQRLVEIERRRDAARQAVRSAAEAQVEARQRLQAGLRAQARALENLEAVEEDERAVLAAAETAAAEAAQERELLQQRLDDNRRRVAQARGRIDEVQRRTSLARAATLRDEEAIEALQGELARALASRRVSLHVPASPAVVAADATPGEAIVPRESTPVVVALPSGAPTPRRALPEDG